MYVQVREMTTKKQIYKSVLLAAILAVFYPILFILQRVFEVGWMTSITYVLDRTTNGPLRMFFENVARIHINGIEPIVAAVIIWLFYFLYGMAVIVPVVLPSTDLGRRKGAAISLAVIVFFLLVSIMSRAQMGLDSDLLLENRGTRGVIH